jgi:hypothetical protein
MAHLKAKALHILDTATREPGWVPAYARGTQALWTPKLVREALVDAHRMLRRIGGNVGPAQLKGYWPEHQRDYPDDEQQRRDAERKRGSYATAMTPTRMEMVLLGWKDADGMKHPGWLDGPLLLAPDLRATLLSWIKAELRGETFKELCRRKLWTYTTAMTHRDRAAGIIAQRLNAAGMEVW